MPGKTNRLDRLQIPAPCPADWERMTGSEQVRYCDGCDKYVYNLSSMTRDQAEAIVATAKGGLCARVTRDADGTTLTTERHAGLRLISRRASPIASAVVTAIMSISTAAQPPSTLASAYVSGYSESGFKKPGPQAQAEDGSATLWGTVADPSGAVIANAKVTLINASTGEYQTGASSDEGEYRFTLLKAGAYTLRIESPGFSTAILDEITLRGNEVQNYSVTMQWGKVMSTGGVVAIRAPMPLRELYKESDLIVVARAGETVKARGEGEHSLMVTTLNVSSTIKGEGKRSKVYVYHWEYQGEEQDMYARGDNLLVFLKKREGEKGRKAKDAYEVDNSADGVKKLSEAELGAYLKHIKELEAIMSEDNPQAEEIVEWLVRCVEDRATRWEGAVELERSAARLRDRTETASDTDDEEDKSTAEPDEDEASPDEAGEQAAEPKLGIDDTGFDSKLASLLTAQQKERLASALFNTESFAVSEFVLLNLVKDLGDARLGPYLMSQLRKAESNPTYVSGYIMRAVGDLLEDEEVSNAAVEFSEVVTSEDDAAGQPRVEQSIVAPASPRRIAMLREFISLAEKKMGARPATPLSR